RYVCRDAEDKDNRPLVIEETRDPCSPSSSATGDTKCPPASHETSNSTWTMPRRPEGSRNRTFADPVKCDRFSARIWNSSDEAGFSCPRNLNWSRAMGRYLLLWLLGVPIPILILIWAFGGLH